MAFTAPSLVTVISGAGYRTEIDYNFASLHNAMADIQTSIDALAVNSNLSISNMPWIPYALMPDGVIGYHGLPLSFAGDKKTVTISPTVAPVMIGGKFHIVTAAQAITVNIENLNPLDATTRIAIGLTSNSAPNASWIAVASPDTPSDIAAGIQLLVYEFESVRAGGVYTVKNLRRGCPILMDGTAHDRAIRPYNQIGFNSTGVLRTTVGAIAAGALMQEPCEIYGVYARLGVSPPAGKTITMQVRKFGGGTTNLVLSDLSWTNADPAGTVKSAGQVTPAPKLEAGDFVFPYLTSVSDTGLAADLCVSLRVRPLILI